LLQISLKARPASEESSQFSAADQNPLQRQELSRSKTRPPLNQASQLQVRIHLARLLAKRRGGDVASAEKITAVAAGGLYHRLHMREEH